MSAVSSRQTSAISVSVSTPLRRSWGRGDRRSRSQRARPVRGHGRSWGGRRQRVTQGTTSQRARTVLGRPETEGHRGHDRSEGTHGPGAAGDRGSQTEATSAVVITSEKPDTHSNVCRREDTLRVPRPVIFRLCREHSRFINPRLTGGGLFRAPPPSRFLAISSKPMQVSPPNLQYLLSQHFYTLC